MKDHLLAFGLIALLVLSGCGGSKQITNQQTEQKQTSSQLTEHNKVQPSPINQAENMLIGNPSSENQKQFNKVKIGMTREQVMQAIGEPDYYNDSKFYTTLMSRNIELLEWKDTAKNGCLGVYISKLSKKVEAVRIFEMTKLISGLGILMDRDTVLYHKDIYGMYRFHPEKNSLDSNEDWLSKLKTGMNPEQVGEVLGAPFYSDGKLEKVDQDTFDPFYMYWSYKTEGITILFLHGKAQQKFEHRKKDGSFDIATFR